MYDPTKPHNHILVEQAKRTWNSNKLIYVLNDGSFARQGSYAQSFEIDHTDGIGSKGIFHWQYRTFRNAVLDALAMNINDLLMYRAKPFKLQNHIFLPHDDKEAITHIATALADECVDRNIVITGGECAVHNEGLEISITMSGTIDQRYPNAWEEGDVLIGLASNGLHSNGTTLARSLLNFKPEWLTPTRIYDLPTWPEIIKGIQHITGGAFTKLKKHLNGVDAYITCKHSLYPQELFFELYDSMTAKSADSIMYKTFNCGVGMILSVAKEFVDKVMGKIGGDVIGEIRKGTGMVHIESCFSDMNITF